MDAEDQNLDLTWMQKIRIWIWHEQNDFISVHFNPFSFTGWIPLCTYCQYVLFISSRQVSLALHPLIEFMCLLCFIFLKSLL